MPRINAVIGALLVFVVTVAVALLAVSKNPSTPFDEPAHWDYLEKVSTGVIPPVNDRYGQVVLSSIACSESRGGEAWQGLELCGSDYYTPEKAPFGGLSSATGYSPTYYAISSVPYLVCQKLTDMQKLTCARASNTLWLGLSGAGLYVLAILLGASSLLGAAYALGTLTIPSVLLQGSTFNSDAASFALLPIFFVIAILINRSNFALRRFAPWVLVTLVSVAFVTTKETLLPGVLIGILYFTVNNVRRNLDVETKEIVLKAALSVAMLFLISLLSRILQGEFRGIAGKADMDLALAIPLSELPNSMAWAVQEAVRPFHLIVWPVFQTPVFQMIAELASVVTWVALASVHFYNHDSELKETKSILAKFHFPQNSILLAWTLPAVLAVATWIGSHNAPVQPRYYMSTAMVLGIIGLATTKWKTLSRLSTVFYFFAFGSVVITFI